MRVSRDRDGSGGGAATGAVGTPAGKEPRMGGLFWFLLFAGLFYFMMRFGCGAHVVHGGHGGHGGHEEHAGHGAPPVPLYNVFARPKGLASTRDE